MKQRAQGSPVERNEMMNARCGLAPSTPVSRFVGRSILAVCAVCMSATTSAQLPEQVLPVRREQQLKAAAQQKAFHDFQFQDRIAGTGISFVSRAVDDVTKNNKPIHYDHGTALAAADVNGDQLADLYFVSQLGGNELWVNLGNGRFRNITESAGVALQDRICVGASFADLDNDGDPDLFVTTVRGGNVLFENLGQGRFRDISKQAGVDYSGHSSTAVFFDYDNDGLLDLFVSNVGRYTTDRKGAGGYYIGVDEGFSSHLNPAFNETSLLYRNEGGLKFKRQPASVLNHVGWSGEAVVSDVNGDGFPDLYVMNMQGDDRFYINEGGQRFVEQTARYFPKTPWGAMGGAFLDFNNDAHFDLFITDMHSDMTSLQIRSQTLADVAGERTKSDRFCRIEWTEEFLQDSSNNIFGNAFWQASGHGAFTEVSDAIGAETYWPWGPTVADFNADGFQDLFVASGMGYPFPYACNILLLNEAGKKFVPSEFTLGIEPRLDGRVTVDYFTLDCAGADKGHPVCQGRNNRVAVEGTVSSRTGVAWDFDDDGDLDLVTNEMNDRPQFFVSNLTSNKTVHFLKVQLTGTKSNRDGLGAVVKVTSGGQTQTRQHDGKSGYLSQSALPLYFGLPTNSIDKIEIAWPSGVKQTVTNANANSVQRITEVVR